jgi:hypothetical protein
MRIRMLAGLLCAGALAVPAVSAASSKHTRGMSEDMRRAIAFERHKAEADARQARIEARHPTVPPVSANRSAEKEVPPGARVVHDPGPAGYRK